MTIVAIFCAGAGFRAALKAYPERSTLQTSNGVPRRSGSDRAAFHRRECSRRRYSASVSRGLCLWLELADKILPALYMPGLITFFETEIVLPESLGGGDEPG